ncbi:hypothetical protein VN97_g12171, partial [Penicillium thymicola]
GLYTLLKPSKHCLVVANKLINSK